MPLEELDPKKLLSATMPDDMTLAEARDFWLSLPETRPLKEMAARTGKLTIRFLAEDHETELPDTMTLAVFRDLCIAKRASIVIDDGTGGSRVKSPEPELV